MPEPRMYNLKQLFNIFHQISRHGCLSVKINVFDIFLPSSPMVNNQSSMMIALTISTVFVHFYGRVRAPRRITSNLCPDKQFTFVFLSATLFTAITGVQVQKYNHVVYTKRLAFPCRTPLVISDPGARGAWRQNVSGRRKVFGRIFRATGRE